MIDTTYPSATERDRAEEYSDLVSIRERLLDLYSTRTTNVYRDVDNDTDVHMDVWIVGDLTFSVDSPPDTIGELINEIGIAVSEYGAVMERRDMLEYAVSQSGKVCPKCQHTSGDDWKQCGDWCPMPGSPHHTGAA